MSEKGTNLPLSLTGKASLHVAEVSEELLTDRYWVLAKCVCTMHIPMCSMVVNRPAFFRVLGAGPMAFTSSDRASRNSRESAWGKGPDEGMVPNGVAATGGGGQTQERVDTDQE